MLGHNFAMTIIFTALIFRWAASVGDLYQVVKYVLLNPANTLYDFIYRIAFLDFYLEYL